MPFKPWIAAGALALVAALAWFAGRSDSAAPVAAEGPPVPSGAPRFLGQTAAGAPAPALPSERAERLKQLTAHLELVDKTYCDYRAGTRYPQASRPASEHPDQTHPNQPVTEAHPLRSDGKRTDATVEIQTSQSRVFMVAGEVVSFSIRALEADGGQPLPLVITRAVAQGMTYKGARPTTQVALAFADDGKGADAVEGDGAFAGVLAPAQTGLASFNGTIRSEIRYSAGGKPGFVLFDVIYTPEVPAVWSGAPREVLEGGSLVYVLKAEVRQAGRYIVTGRVDDARGQPFALATFNDLLPTGPNEIRLTVFGKLLRDQAPALPLTLRDVDAYLLKENADPDRALMARLEGKLLTGKPHALNGFSDAEWQGEERTRHLAEFGKDVALAKQALASFDPALPLPKSACLP